MPVYRPAASSILRSFRASGKRHLLLTGGRGSGKNNAAARTYAISLPRCPDASHRCRPGQMGRDARYSHRGSGGHRPV